MKSLPAARRCLADASDVSGFRQGLRVMAVKDVYQNRRLQSSSGGVSDDAKVKPGRARYKASETGASRPFPNKSGHGFRLAPFLPRRSQSSTQPDGSSGTPPCAASFAYGLFTALACRKYLFGVGFGIDFADDVFHDAVFVNQDGLADGTHHGFPVHLLFAPGSVCLEDFRGRI